MEKPYIVFCCYAREDKELLQLTKKHLRPLEREGLIMLKADVDISPGWEWEPTISHYLDIADIILLLISPDFIDSNYCFDEEMKRAIERHEQGTARVVPVIIRPTTWHKMPFGKLQALPQDAKPISISQNVDIALMSVAKGVRIIVQELTKGITPDWKSAYPSHPPIQENALPTRSQGRNDMDTKDDSSNYTIKNKGPVYGQVIGGHHDQVITGETIYINGKQKDGMRALEMGAKALLNGNYSSARKELHIAIEEIDQEQQKREAAKAHYLQTLAILDKDLPRVKGEETMQVVEQLLSTALQLDTSSFYFWSLALIREDYFLFNGLRSRLGEITHLEYQAAHTPWNDDIDTLNLKYFQHCQPELSRKFATKVGKSF